MQPSIPACLNAKTAIFNKYFAGLSHPLSAAVQTLLMVSDYACRQIQILRQLLNEDDCQQLIGLEVYQEQLSHLPCQTQVIFAKALRQFRHRQFLRLLLREGSGLANIEETMACWSDCADAIILRTITFCQQELSERYGQPLTEAGLLSQIFTIAMGKLGGRELNFSSDIDLIFAYSAMGHTDGREQISNELYYIKLVQLFIQLLQNNTAEGFVFRVDLRLRPNGDSGSLVPTLAAMETYYQEQGRDWERYAMVKARLVGEDTQAPHHWFNRLITPFVYRRYVDFSVIESLRSMKAMIEREVKLNPMLDDIKRGFGGIREVEFIIQNIQLIRGGRLSQLRDKSTLKALAALKKEGLLPRAEALKQAYLFLRKLENILQSLDDRQTHSLPVDPVKRAQVSLAMNFSDWELLLERLRQYQRIVSLIFRAGLSQIKVYEDEHRLLANQLNSLWQGHVESGMAINLLTSIGFQQAERCYQMLHIFRHSPRCRRLSQAARLRLDRFIPLLLTELSKMGDTDKLLSQLLHLLENIVGRSAYLALLSENPQILNELLYWFSNSPFITSLLVNQPFLLEILLNEEQEWKLPSIKQLKQQLKAQLAQCQDSEAQEEILRQFKLIYWFSAARAEVFGCYEASQIARFLAGVAEVIVVEVMELACEQLSQRYPQIIKIKAHFSIIAYGKLGSREMNYNSDLDLVFIHSVCSEEENLVTRLTQKIIHMLTTRSQTGILYHVDTRLRPSGSAGLLVSHLRSFIDYQRTQAWTWEHQAILRARVISGSKLVKSSFEQLKLDILFLPRDLQVLRDEVLAMRAKIKQHSDSQKIKYAPGGLVDLEFLVQFLLLANPKIAFAKESNTLAFLVQLSTEKVLNRRQFKQLKAAYNAYHQVLHQALLQPGIQDCTRYQADVMEISQLEFSQF